MCNLSMFFIGPPGICKGKRCMQWLARDMLESGTYRVEARICSRLEHSIYPGPA